MTTYFCHHGYSADTCEKCLLREKKRDEERKISPCTTCKGKGMILVHPPIPEKPWIKEPEEKWCIECGGSGIDRTALLLLEEE